MYEKWVAYVQQLLNPSSRLQNAQIIRISTIYWSSSLNRLDICCKLHLLLLYCVVFYNYDLNMVILDVWMCKQDRCYSAIPDIASGFNGRLCCNVFIFFFLSGSLRFSQFSGCWLILSVYVFILMMFDFPFVRLFGVR